jgi:hypothetical protein
LGRCVSHGKSSGAAKEPQHESFRESLAEQAGSRSTESDAHHRLRAMCGSLREQQIRDISAGDQEHESRRGGKQAQAVGVSGAQARHSAARGTERDVLLGSFTPVSFRDLSLAGQPLLDFQRYSRLHLFGFGFGLYAVDDVQLMQFRVRQERAVRPQKGFAGEWDPKIRRISAQRFTKKFGRGDADDGCGMSVD